MKKRYQKSTALQFLERQKKAGVKPAFLII